MDQISLVIEILKVKKQLSALEKDILDTLNEYQKCPFDIDSANRQIISNNINHPDIFAMVTALPTTVSKPKEQINLIELSCSVTSIGNVLQPCTARLPISCVSSRIRLGLGAPITPPR